MVRWGIAQWQLRCLYCYSYSIVYYMHYYRIKLHVSDVTTGCVYSIYGLIIYTGCSAKMYSIFVLFISPVKIEIFQVCLFHIIGNFVFHPQKILRVRVEDAFQALKNDR